jgi:hypothetical protein
MRNPKDSKKAILQTEWTVTLRPLAERELQTIPADMQARFLHSGEMLEELVLHVFVKKTQTTPRSEIETALKRLEEST